MTSFKFGLSAFIVPFMFFYSPALLMDGHWWEILRVVITASIGIYLLAAAVQGYFMSGRTNVLQRLILLLAALAMIAGGWMTDLLGIGLGSIVLTTQLVASFNGKISQLNWCHHALCSTLAGFYSSPALVVR
ncbi:hypothetical protein HAALTHF_41900n [Vreelandella aquamarina]|nr:hypothetical protein HAALTHF_41900n [Halomonas axialensis]